MQGTQGNWPKETCRIACNCNVCKEIKLIKLNSCLVKKRNRVQNVHDYIEMMSCVLITFYVYSM